MHDRFQHSLGSERLSPDVILSVLQSSLSWRCTEKKPGRKPALDALIIDVSVKQSKAVQKIFLQFLLPPPLLYQAKCCYYCNSCICFWPLPETGLLQRCEMLLLCVSLCSSAWPDMAVRCSFPGWWDKTVWPGVSDRSWPVSAAAWTREPRQEKWAPSTPPLCLPALVTMKVRKRSASLTSEEPSAFLWPLTSSLSLCSGSLSSM